MAEVDTDYTLIHDCTLTCLDPDTSIFCCCCFFILFGDYVNFFSKCHRHPVALNGGLFFFNIGITWYLLVSTLSLWNPLLVIN